MGSTYLVENQEIPQGDVKIPSLKKTNKQQKKPRWTVYSLFFLRPKQENKIIILDAC